MGRPTKLTKARHDKIVRDIRKGNFAQVAALASGVTEQTYYNWLKRGQDEALSDDPDTQQSIYAKFFEAVKTAEATAELRQVDEMQRDDKWQRRAWWLERRFPKRWGQKQSVELSGPEGKPVEVDARPVLEAFLDERKQQISEAQQALTDADE